MRTWHKWVLLTAAWAFVAMVWATYFFAQGAIQGRSVPYIRHLVAGFVLFSFWLAITPLIGKLAYRFPLRRERRIPNIGIHLLLSAAVFVVHMCSLGILAPTTFILLGWDTWSGYWAIQTVTTFFFNLRGPVDVALYWLLIVAFTAGEYYTQAQERTLRAAELERELLEAQLVQLRTQLQPHFLFNTLHSLVSMIQSDNKNGAITMAVGLGDLLRTMATEIKQHETQLRDELKLLRTYLDIEMVRFQDRLKVRFEIAAEVESAYVPVLLLQPLVDNAIRHGISVRQGQGTLTVGARRIGNDLIVRIENQSSGPATDSSSDGLGIGLANTRQRLEHLYGTNWAVDLDTVDNHRSVVTVRIPYSLTPVYEARPE
jgi:two-component system LytT family sensor kinase